MELLPTLGCSCEEQGTDEGAGETTQSKSMAVVMLVVTKQF